MSWAGGSYSSTNPTGQLFDPATNQLTDPIVMPILYDANPLNLYPFLLLLPNGLVLAIAGGLTRFYRCANNFCTSSRLLGLD